MSPSPGRTPDFSWVLDEKVSQLVRRKARKLARSPGFSRSDEDDIEQELRLHLLRKAAKYTSTRSQATTFARRLIENKAASMARKTRAGMRSYRRNAISLNDRVATSNDGSSELCNILDSSVGRRHTGQRSECSLGLANLKLDMAEINRELPAPMKELAALLCHIPKHAAGKVLGISRRQTARRLALIREAYEARGVAGWQQADNR